MGWLDVFCAWLRPDAVRDTETEVLVAPVRARRRGTSVTSQDGYGTMAMRVGAPRASRVTDAQKERMAEISRAAGSHMRPIDGYRGRSSSPVSSGTSSRAHSPSPARPQSSPPGGVMSAISTSPTSSAPRVLPTHLPGSRDSKDSRGSGSRHSASSSRHSFSRQRPSIDEVVHKSIFDGAAPGRPGKSGKGSLPSSRRSSNSSKKKRRGIRHVV
ncbi:hypothetical protein CspeluHIS016_0208510 [Cutaneotrichosporon spelunceum]|uniref:Uncharacterized protein n=1 Tax=Cutaneotrichosporon spelunceum TaxID=1672016 RepID=A0AAD3TSU5_9TREE|nr:hypothetical protein CspeluHIS016_0208510 [Cutaneotrichosporon spelunceum]